MIPLSASFFTQTAEFHLRRWLVELPSDVTFEDLFQPEFWRLASPKLARLDEITVIGGADQTLDMTLRVVNVGAGYAILREIYRSPSKAADSEASVTDDTPRAAFFPGRKWCKLSPDGDVVADGFRSRAEAEAAL